MRALLVLLLALLAFEPQAASAHEVRPALFQAVETVPGRWQVTWKQPVMGDRAVRLEPHLSNGWLAKTALREELTSSYYLRRWSIKAPSGTVLPLRCATRTLPLAIVLVAMSSRNIGFLSVAGIAVQ